MCEVPSFLQDQMNIVSIRTEQPQNVQHTPLPCKLKETISPTLCQHKLQADMKNNPKITFSKTVFQRYRTKSCKLHNYIQMKHLKNISILQIEFFPPRCNYNLILRPLNPLEFRNRSWIFHLGPTFLGNDTRNNSQQRTIACSE